MERKFGFSTFQDVARRAAGRPIVLFGAGNIAAKTSRRIGRKLSFLVDNNPNLWDTQQLGVTVRPPETLTGAEARPFILICTTSFTDVAAQLAGMGFEIGHDFLVSPVLNDLRIIAELESLKTSLLFTNGLPPSAAETGGGGLYELDVDGDWTVRKVHSGSCHGILAHGDNFLVVDDERGLMEIDRDYRVVRSRPLPPASRGHGVAYCAELERYYVACSYADKVLAFDRNFEPAGEILLSHKCARDKAPAHHCNDICVVGTSLYVSMFSLTGNWKRDIFDGGVLEFDLVSGERVGPVVTDLWMPHNIDFMDGSLVVCDSLRGELRKGNAQPVGRFPGFTRGLAGDGTFHYVGQSRNRNFSRYMGLSQNISIDTSIIVFDEETKVSRSLFLPASISEIHGIALLQPFADIEPAP